MMIDPIGFMFGYMLGVTLALSALLLITLKIGSRIRGIVYRLRSGVCFRYDPEPLRRTVDGTSSFYCKRCGHAGYQHFVGNDD